MNFPMGRYIFSVKDNEVIAASSYGGRPVRGIAKCNPEDKFDLETGKEIAALRCGLKVAKKRASHAEKRLRAAILALNEAEKFYKKMLKYFDDAEEAEFKAREELNEKLKEVGVK